MSALFTQQAIRRGLRELAASQPFTHCLTLNADRELTAPRMKSIFGTFCMMVDRRIHGRQRVRRIPSSDRFNAIAFPEHLDTNAHLHALADLSPLMDIHHNPRALERVVRSCWLGSTRGAGSIDLQELRSAGFGGYSTKATRGSDPLYFLSSDYHPK